jgi:hypothetical protein
LAEDDFAIRNSQLAIGLQCRYALIVASINSLVQNLPLKLVAALVRENVWTPVQGFAYTCQVPDPERRLETFIELVPQLPEPLKREALQRGLATAQKIDCEDTRMEALAKFVPHLSGQDQEDVREALQRGLATAQKIDCEDTRMQALAKFVPHLSGQDQEDVLSQVLEATRALDSELERVRRLSRLTPHLPESLLREVLPELRVVAGYWWAVQFGSPKNPHPLVASTQRLAELGYPQDALAAARMIEDEYWRVKALTSLVPYFQGAQRDGVLRETLAATRAIKESITREGFYTRPIHSPQGARADALTGMLPFLPEPLKSEALWEALEVVWEIEGGKERAQTLAGLAPHLPEALKAEVLREALTAAREIRKVDERMKAVAQVALHLPVSLKSETLSEMLAAVWELSEGEQVGENPRLEALNRLSPYLPEPLLREALAARLVIEDGGWQWMALADLASHLSGPMKDQIHQGALATMQRKEHKQRRTMSLLMLSHCLSEPLKSEALKMAVAAAQQIESEPERALTLARLVPHLPKSQKSIVMHGLLTEASKKEVKAVRTDLLMILARHMSESLLWTSLRKARVILDVPDKEANAFDAERVVMAVAPRLAALGYSEKALAAARKVRKGFWRAHTMSKLLALLPESLKDEAMREIIDTVWKLKDHEARQACLLAELAPYLPETLLQEALILAREFEEDDLWEAPRALALSGLAPCLPESEREDGLRDALYAARNARDWGPLGTCPRAEALTNLIPHLSASLLPEALAVAWKIRWESDRMEVLTQLTPWLRGLPIETLTPLWRKTLHALTSRARKDLLVDLRALSPIVAVLGGEEAVRETIVGIQDVGRWWS